jgi:hypothetical protein
VHPLIYCSFASIGHADMMWSIVSSNWWQSLHLLSVSVLSIFVAKYLVCNAWSCAATISLSVSAFKSPFVSLLLLLLSSSTATTTTLTLGVISPCITCSIFRSG